MARSITILLVEDDPDDALLVHLALQKILPGVSLPLVSDGGQAIEYLKGSGGYSDRSAYPFPDVVLLDLKLPIINGFEVLRWIRQQPELKLLPIIGLTGSIREGDVLMAREAGANACVLKSQGFQRLAELLMEVSATGSREGNQITEICPEGVGLSGTIGGKALISEALPITPAEDANSEGSGKQISPGLGGQ